MNPKILLKCHTLSSIDVFEDFHPIMGISCNWGCSFFCIDHNHLDRCDNTGRMAPITCLVHYLCNACLSLATLNEFSRHLPWTFIACFEVYNESFIDSDSELTDVPLFRRDYCANSKGNTWLGFTKNLSNHASCRVVFTKTDNLYTR